ncbi:MAG: GUN4 domain-containing protein [Cyanobacteria bacterium P01_G01_bin.54]
MLEQFISTLEQAKIERHGDALDAVEIADLLWLALHRDGGEAAGGEVSSTVGDEPERATETPRSPSTQTQQTTAETPETETPETPGAKVYPSGGRSQSSQQGIPFKTPAAAALRNPLALARALRPLMRKARSRTVQVLDERATVQQTIEEGRVVPVLRPALERWFEVALVIEESGSWGIWQQTLAELAQLLARQGAFRAVQVWWARVDGADGVKLRSGNGRVVRPQALADPAGRRLVLLASDCTSAAWSDGTWLAFLRQWGARLPVTVLQLLPEVMWRQTALGQSEGVQLGATVPGAVNTRLRLERETWWLEEGEVPTLDLVPVPVISLEPYGLRDWARVMAGVAQARLAGYGFSELDTADLAEEEAVLALNGAALFERFWATASPLARRLAALMAATSVTFPIVRLIQQVMVPRSSTVQVAEVFLSGMLELAAANDDPERRRYEFVAGVRALLLGTIPRWEALSVIEQVSGFVARRLGVSLREFEAMIFGEGDGELDEGVEAFAKVMARVLRYLELEITVQKNKLQDNNQNTVEENRQLTTSEKQSKSSDKPIDNLLFFLEKKQWKKADQETAITLLESVNKSEGNLSEEDIENIPLELLCEIDELWLKASNGKFGFTAQQEIWEQISEQGSQEQKFITKFGEYVGWSKEGNWCNYSEIQFSIDAPKGHLPVLGKSGWYSRLFEVALISNKLKNELDPELMGASIASGNAVAQRVFSDITNLGSEHDASISDEISELAISAQNSPKDSSQRKQKLDRLVRSILGSGQLVEPVLRRFPHLQEVVYEEAVQRMLTYIVNNIDQYNPENSVTEWINHLLIYRFFKEALQEYTPHFRMNHAMQMSIDIQDLELDSGIEDLTEFYNLEDFSLSQQLRTYIEEDPDNILKFTHIKGHPGVNFRILAIRRLDGYTWQELSDEMNIPIPSLASFYNRCLKRFAPSIKAYLES